MRAVGINQPLNTTALFPVYAKPIFQHFECICKCLYKLKRASPACSLYNVHVPKHLYIFIFPSAPLVLYFLPRSLFSHANTSLTISLGSQVHKFILLLLEFFQWNSHNIMFKMKWMISGQRDHLFVSKCTHVPFHCNWCTKHCTNLCVI